MSNASHKHEIFRFRKWSCSITRSLSVAALTWHDHKGPLGFHGDQACAEDGRRISSRNATHATCLTQLPANRVQRVFTQQQTPI